MMKHPCPCCLYLTFDSQPDGSFEICPVCYWEDDFTQLNDPDYAGGANGISLKDAKLNFKEFGAIKREFISSVRIPNPDEEKES